MIGSVGFFEANYRYTCEITGKTVAYDFSEGYIDKKIDHARQVMSGSDLNVQVIDITPFRQQVKIIHSETGNVLLETPSSKVLGLRTHWINTGLIIDTVV